MRAAPLSAVGAASAPAGGARGASATAAHASRIRHPLEHCALAWPCRTYLGFPRQVRMANLAERFAIFGGPEKSIYRGYHQAGYPLGAKGAWVSRVSPVSEGHTGIAGIAGNAGNAGIGRNGWCRLVSAGIGVPDHRLFFPWGRYGECPRIRTYIHWA